MDKSVTGHVLRQKITDMIAEQGMQHMYKITLTGYRDPDIWYELDHMDPYGNVVEITDHTKPAYDFTKLKNENKLLKNKNISIIKEFEFPNFDIKKDKKINPVIVGSGPAGLFAGLTFVQNGFKPIIIEQGQSVEERKKSVDSFTSTGNLNTFSNVQFGRWSWNFF